MKSTPLRIIENLLLAFTVNSISTEFECVRGHVQTLRNTEHGHPARLSRTR